MKDGYGAEALAEAFEIFSKYSDRKWLVQCQHDEMLVRVSEEVGEEDRERLEELGFNKDELYEKTYIFFRHGSC